MSDGLLVLQLNYTNSGSRSRSESTTDKDKGEVHFSVWEEDEAEERQTNDFIVKGYGCSLGPQKSASKYCTREEISTTQMNCREMSTTELDMLVLANLEAHYRYLE